MYKVRKIAVGKICDKFNINRRSFYRYLKENGQNH
ncbi:MAG: helix-turn-helix domain-containing protein [Oligoflexia bacterium]|nr:helix-turn-helix domain-containing protein [Oligoflexia bacterium]